MALEELSIFKMALVPLVQAEMVPSSVEKTKWAPPKSALGLKMMPVGADGGVAPLGGGNRHDK